MVLSANHFNLSVIYFLTYKPQVGEWISGFKPFIIITGHHQPMVAQYQNRAAPNAELLSARAQATSSSTHPQA